MSSCDGYLTLRTSPSAPPPMVRRYCVIVGTALTYYCTQEDAEHMMNLKGEVDVIGVQEWDGKGNVHIYANSFLFATSQSKIFYAYADTPTEKEKWMRAIQMNVERTVPILGSSTLNNIVLDLQRTPELSPNSIGSSSYDMDSSIQCGICKDKTSSGRYKCYSCDNFFCEKHASNEIPLPQSNYYSAKRVCEECYNCQRFINFLKSILNRLKNGIYLFPNGLDPEIPIELVNPLCRPSHTNATNIALDLFRMGEINSVELEQLLIADQRYQDFNADDPEIPLDLEILALHRELRSEDFFVCRGVVLLHKYAKKSPMLYKPIVEKLLVLSYSNIDEIEFYWPQIGHAYITIPIYDFDKMFWMDELILSICSRSIHLALLLMWQLQGSLQDAQDLPSSSTTKEYLIDRYTRSIHLMLEIEATVANKDRLSLFTGNEDKRQNPPKAADEQIVVLRNLLEELDYFRRSSLKSKRITGHSVREIMTRNGIKCIREFSSPYLKIEDEKVQDKEIELKTIPINKSLTSLTEEVDLTENTQTEAPLFSDFSLFQQHLLTPLDEPGSPQRLKQTIESCKKLGDKRVSSTTVFSFDEKTSNRIENTHIHRDESFCSPVKRERAISEADKSVLASYFADEMDFIDHITAIAERMRFVQPITDRKKVLAEELAELEIPEMTYIPLIKATDSYSKIIRIPPEEAIAFSTKSRVPIMVIFEVLKGGGGTKFQPSPSPSGKTPILDVDDEVGELLDHHSPTDFSNLVSGGEETECPDIQRRSTQVVLNYPFSISSDYLSLEQQKEQEHEYEQNQSRLSSSSNSLQLDLTNLGELSAEALERERNRKNDLQAAFGESWQAKRARLQKSSPYGHLPGWEIVSMIAKSNDDLRQEVFTLQIMQKFLNAFKAAKLPMWLNCYRIISTSSSTGLIETLINAISLDGLKKRDGYTTLANHFEKSYGSIDSQRFITARSNFISSMASYSLVCYFLQIKDRHNGNIMIDDEGHIIHIDFGFILGIAPGGSFSIETAPFKLTTEMVDTMGGVDSDSFKEYVTLCTRGFLALQKRSGDICDFVEIMAHESPYPCFQGKDIGYILSKLRSRFKHHYTKKEVVDHVLNLIKKSNGNYNTRQYDNFQRMSNGIMP